MSNTSMTDPLTQAFVLIWEDEEHILQWLADGSYTYPCLQEPQRGPSDPTSQISVSESQSLDGEDDSVDDTPLQHSSPVSRPI
jgi:hypothetical protein